MSEPVVLRQRSTRTAVRRQLILLVPVIGIGGVVAFQMARGNDVLRPYAWLVGPLVALLAAALVCVVRLRRLAARSASGRLTIDENGLRGELGGTVRTLAWPDITALGPVARRTWSRGSNGTSVGGPAVAGSTPTGRSPDADSIGVIGPGEWLERPEADHRGRSLLRTTRNRLGVDARTGRAMVPFWFADYEENWENGQLGAALRQHRPDLWLDWQNRRPRPPV